MTKKEQLSTLSEFNDADFLLGNIPGFLVIKDLNSVYIKGCVKTAKKLGLKHGNDMSGLTDYSVKHEISKYGDLFTNQDQKLIQKNAPIMGFYEIFYDNAPKYCFFTKNLLKDISGNNLGLIAHCTILECQYLNSHIVKLFNEDFTKKARGKGNISKTYFLNEPYNNINLSKRQMQCLFYLLRGKSVRAIATILGLSQRTIESYVEHIKNKMGCPNKSSLIEKSIELGYLELIPPEVNLEFI